MNWEIWLPKLAKEFGLTLYMVGASTALTVLFGLPLGVILNLTASKGLSPKPALYKGLSAFVNIGRSLPFIILLVAILPFTRILVGTTIGAAAAIPPLTLAAIPFFARIVETALSEVDRGLLEAVQSMGGSLKDAVFKVLIPEAMPSLIAGVALTLISLIGYSAMAGAIGGGGLGDLAIRYGYQRRETGVMLITVVLLLAVVQAIQSLGSFLARKASKR
ncbi:MAG: methionine ABC transporter permease [Anaerolineaceae bacterium]|nr:methionine ABC transporter permease [Anaerolineaceae bacterium]